MRLRRTAFRWVTSLAAATAVAAGTSGSAYAEDARAPIGGPLLGSTGPVVRPGHGVPPLPRSLSASSWLVADLDTGEVLAARDAHRRFAPASTLKMLTAVTLIPRLNPARVVVTTPADVTVVGSRVGLVPGGRARVDQLLTAMLVVSGNDAANALGSAAGGAGAVVRLMNETAAQLQARDTVAKTTHGLDAPGQVSSAYDLALIARAGMAMPAFRRYVAIRSSTFPAPGGRSFQIYTHNKLLDRYPGAIGIKNGYTSAARASFVGAARRGGRTLLVTLMHANITVWQEAGDLLSWGFRASGAVEPVRALVAPLPPPDRPGSPRGSALAAGEGTAPAGPATTSRVAGVLSRGLAALAVLGVLLLAVGQRRRVVLARRRRNRRLRPRRVDRHPSKTNNS